MKRRQFLKNFAALGATPYIPAGLTMASFSQLAKAAPIDYVSAGFANPTNNIMPQVINIFLYGGPSELAGNLTNIDDIEANSQNSYRAQFNDNEFLDRVVDGGQLTVNGFWQDAGGAEMESMLTAGDMSIYRTMLKEKSPTRSHRESIFMSHKGSIDIEGTPGVGTRLAAYLLHNKTSVDNLLLADGVPLSSLVGGEGLNSAILPFVSFEGETNSYTLDPNYYISPALRGLSVSEDFDNPYARDDILPNQATANATFDNLLTKIKTTEYINRFSAANNRFELRDQMDNITAELDAAQGIALPTGANYTGSNFSDRVRAAVTLALHNPSSFYITVGGGLGGWDDHNNGVDRYPDRMQDVMQTMQAAIAHINGFTSTTITNGAGNNRTTIGNIVINVFGDFGRLVNLNGSNGWDHANNQNLYTFGGEDLRPGQLGKIVGATHRVGTSNTNNQFTMPIGLDRNGEGTANTYHFEPMAVAATTYSYFGAQDTRPLTESPEMGEAGDDPIDQTTAGEALNQFA